MINVHVIKKYGYNFVIQRDFNFGAQKKALLNVGAFRFFDAPVAMFVLLSQV